MRGCKLETWLVVEVLSSFHVPSSPALSELFVLGDSDLKQTRRLHQGGHCLLMFPDHLVKLIHHLVRLLAVKPEGRISTHMDQSRPITGSASSRQCLGNGRL